MQRGLVDREDQRDRKAQNRHDQPCDADDCGVTRCPHRASVERRDGDDRAAIRRLNQDRAFQRMSRSG